jgi:lipopolysaccharide exporter
MPLPPVISKLRDRLLQGPLKAGSFIRNVLTVIAGTAVSQAIAIVTIPLLARLYSPSHFGALAKYTVAASVLAVFSCLSYQAAIVLAKRDESAFGLLINCLFISLLVCLLTALGIGAFDTEMAIWLDSPDLLEWIWLIPLGILARSWFTAFQLWNTRYKQFSNNAKGQVAKRLVGEGSKFGLYSVFPSSLGLIIGTLLGTFAGLAFVANKALKNTPQKYWKNISFRRSLILLQRYRNFPLYDLFSSTIATISRNLPVILLGYFFSSAVVGFFYLAHRMVAAPLQLGATSVTQVYFQRANEAKQKGDLDVITMQVFERLLVIFFTPLSLLCIAAPEITLVVLGPDWQESGVYLRWLSLWLFFTSIASPMHRIFAILERQNELAIINALIFTVSAATLIIGGLKDDPTFAIALFSVGVSVAWLIQGLWTLYISGTPLANYFLSLIKESVRVAPFAAVLGASRYLTDNPLIIAAVFAICVVAFGLLRARFILTRGN